MEIQTKIEDILQILKGLNLPPSTPVRVIIDDKDMISETGGKGRWAKLAERNSKESPLNETAGEAVRKASKEFRNNFKGGMILLGVEDDGTISGIQRPHLEEWVMDTVFGAKVHPMMLPFYEEVALDEGRRVAVVSFAEGSSKPYVLRHHHREEIFIRVGSTFRLATREQQARLFASGGILHTELLPVAGATWKALDLERLRDYLANIIQDPEIPDTPDQWIQRLVGLGLMTDASELGPLCTIAGLILFGYSPRRYLRQAGLRLIAFEGNEKGYKALLDDVLNGPLVGRGWVDESGSRILADGGIIERFAELFRPFITRQDATIDEKMRRSVRWRYPREAVRETVINALVHRDWTRSVDIEVVLYTDRLEVLSPGSLQNTMTVEKMIAGQRSPPQPSDRGHHAGLWICGSPGHGGAYQDYSADAPAEQSRSRVYRHRGPSSDGVAGWEVLIKSAWIPYSAYAGIVSNPIEQPRGRCGIRPR